MALNIFDFLINNYILAFYAIALLLSILRYRRYFDSLLKFFPVLIGYTLLTEILGKLIRDIDDIQIVYLDQYEYYNSLIYNIFDIIFFLYFFFVFWSIIKRLDYKRGIIVGGILYVAVTIINPFFQNPMLFPQIFSFIIGSIVLIICIVLYLKEFKSSNTGIQYHKNLLFWISIGLLIFYLFYPYILTVGYYNYELYQKLHMRQFHYLLIALMYGCFIIGFILMRRIRPEEELNIS